jgi:hypothetical protein
MSKAETDYNEDSDKQAFAQIGEEGFAKGGYALMSQPNYRHGGSYDPEEKPTNPFEGMGSWLVDKINVWQKGIKEGGKPIGPRVTPIKESQPSMLEPEPTVNWSDEEDDDSEWNPATVNLRF